MSLLPDLLPLAGLLLALNLAYVRLDRFQYQKKIQEYADASLQKIKDLQIPEKIKETLSYRRLAYLSRENKEKIDRKDLQLSGKLYTLLFDTQIDRKISSAIVWVALILFLLGEAHTVGHVQFLVFLFEAKWIPFFLLLLSVLTILSVVFVLAGDRYVAQAHERIDSDTSELLIIAAGLPPEVDYTSADDNQNPR